MKIRESHRKPNAVGWLVLTRSGDHRKIARDFLLRGGRRITPALEAAEIVEDALDKVRVKHFDLILLGPDVGDSELTTSAAGLKKCGKLIPIVLTPAFSDHEELPKDFTQREWQTIEQRTSGDWLGRVAGATGMFYTERPIGKAEDMLRTLFRAIEQAADLVVITDTRGTIEYVNPAFEKLTGYARAEAVGQTPRILKSGEQSADFYRDLWQTIRGGEAFRAVVVNRKKSGESYIVEKTITPVRNADGEVAHFISNDRDISERRRLESALFQAQKMDAIGQLAGGVAHDFNNLLMVISSYAELMQDAIGPEHRLHRNVQEVLSASRRAADRTRQLLAFGRKQAQSLQVLDLNCVLQDISRMLPRLIGEDIELSIVPHDGTGKVKLDPVQIEQVVMNLAANARDAMPQDGKLTITTCDVDLDGEYVATHPVVPAGRYVVLEVSDTGDGIEALHLPHIFEPFYTTRQNGKGTGLGLATVYGIVKQSGGFIWVYSELGMGTAFKIYFPRVEASMRTSLEYDVIPDATKLHGTETLLLVEDENAVRHPAFEFLKQCGYTVIEAKDGLQAVDVVHKHGGTVDLMVTDVVMPGMSGGQLAELLAEKYPNMKVLFVSGYSEQVVLRHQIASLRTNFLQKPFTLKSLAAKVREVLDATTAAAAGAGQ
jgi:PAS domain S-box-containing protein